MERSIAILLDATAPGAQLPTSPSTAGELRGRTGVIENTIDIDRDPAVVFAQCADPVRELRWNPQLRAVEQLTDGPIGAGTRFRMTFAHGAGDSTVTYMRFDPPRSWAAVSRSPRLDVRAEGEVIPAVAGSRVIIRTDLKPHGALRPLAPLLRHYMHSAWNRNLAVLRAELEHRDQQVRSA
jgi:hypothetical protein